jgi:hypothetical protein
MEFLSAPSPIAAAATGADPDARNRSGNESRSRAVAMMRAAPAGPGGFAHDRREAGRFRSAVPVATYGMAPFIAHLIATAQGAPQTRGHRRADPDRAISAYAATSRQPMGAGTALRQYR